jgi:hypothetical protein
LDVKRFIAWLPCPAAGGALALREALIATESAMRAHEAAGAAGTRHFPAPLFF